MIRVEMSKREELVKLALEARKKAYSPYSNFCVGAALLCADGEIFCGTNIENSSFISFIEFDKALVLSVIISLLSNF